MDKAEQILEKHINENDLNFIFHEKKDLWQELLNATNEALGLAHVSFSLPERKSRCCGRCDGVNDLCVADMICDKHNEMGCEICYGEKGGGNER